MKFIKEHKAAIALYALLAMVACCTCIFNNPFGPNDRVFGDSIIMVDNIDSVFTKNDGAAIKDVVIQKDVLKLTVSYTGGCEEHEFRLYATKGLAKSNPPQVSVYLYHNGNNDTCEALPTEYLRFNLTPIKQLLNYDGPVLLRIYAPNADEPYLPLLLYNF